MSLHASLHVHQTSGETLDITSNVQHLENRPSMKSAFIKLKVGGDTITLYFDDISQIDDLAFHASTLAQAARMDWASITGAQRNEGESNA